MNIRGVPQQVHTVLSRRAAERGMSLRACTVAVLTEHVSTPSVDESLAELDQLPEAADQRRATEALNLARAEADGELARGAGRR